MTMWKLYRVTMVFDDRLMGGVPKNPDLIADWIDARKASEPEYRNRQAQAEVAGEPVQTLPELATEVQETVGETDEEMRAWTGFQEDDDGLFVRSDHVKAHLKDCANVLRKRLDIGAFRSKVADRVYPTPRRIRLVRDGEALKVPDGFWEHPVHVMTPRGKRSALKRTDFVSCVTIDATLRVLDDKIVTLPLLEQLFEYGGVHGFGAERGLGNGQYESTISEEELD